MGGGVEGLRARLRGVRRAIRAANRGVARVGPRGKSINLIQYRLWRDFPMILGFL